VVNKKCNLLGTVKGVKDANIPSEKFEKNGDQSLVHNLLKHSYLGISLR